MAWKFGPFTVAAEEVVDVDRINENFYAIVEEVTGELNEHNWAASAFSSDRTKLAENVGLRVRQKDAPFDPDDPTAGIDVPFGTEWHPVNEGSDDKLEYTLITKGGLVWVMASFQFNTDDSFGALFAIQVDGSVLGDSLLGSGDIENDFISFSGAQPPPPLTAYPRANGITPALWGGGSANDIGIPVVVSALVELSAGTYKIETVCRNPRVATAPSATFNSMHVTNRELIILELS